jgi:hypothetical protein
MSDVTPFEVLVPVPLRVPGRVDTAAPLRGPLPATPVLAVVDNTKARALELLLGVGRELRSRGLVADVVAGSKPTAARPVTTELRAEMLVRGHVVLCGVGD